MNSETLLSMSAIVILLLCSACFSATETAFTCLNRTRLKGLAEDGKKQAARTLNLVENYDKLLSSILVGNNVVNIAMASISTVLFVGLLPNIGAAVSTLVITVLVLIFGEIAPKTMARESPENFAMAVTPVMRVIVTILTPVNYLFSKWQNLLRRVFKLNGNKAMSQDELSMLVEEVAETGSIDEDESDLLRNALAFEGQDTEDVLTPRVDIVAVNENTSNKKVAKIFSKCKFSRLPVYDEDLDHIVGILYQKDFYTDTGISGRSIRKLMRKPVFVPSTMKIDETLSFFKQQNTHIAIVTDEFGGTMGLVTMEDILEELVGEIYDEHDKNVEIIRATKKNTYRISGSTDKDQLEHFFDQKLDSESTTAGGWVIEQMGCIPKVGDSFVYNDFTITVTKANSNRVLEIEAQKKPAADHDELSDMI